MKKAESVLQLLGLPAEFGVALLIFCFALAVAPYFSGTDFGVLKIPSFTPVIRKNLRLGGPLALAVTIFLHIPFSQNWSGTDKLPPRRTAREENTPPPSDSTPTATHTPIEPPKPPPINGSELQRSHDGSVHRANLLIPPWMSDPDAVWLDGHEARLVKRTATVIIIEVPADKKNHQIKIEKAGNPTCATTISVTDSDMTLNPCYD